MLFDVTELEPQEATLLALEQVREDALWLDRVARDADRFPELARVLAEVAVSARNFARELEEEVAEQFGEELPEIRRRGRRARRRPELVAAEEAEITDADLLEAVVTEEEETFQFFLDTADEVEDPWLAGLLEMIAMEIRSRLVFLEEEREALMESEGWRGAAPARPPRAAPVAEAPEPAAEETEEETGPAGAEGGEAGS